LCIRVWEFLQMRLFFATSQHNGLVWWSKNLKTFFSWAGLQLSAPTHNCGCCPIWICTVAIGFGITKPAFFTRRKAGCCLWVSSMLEIPNKAPGSRNLVESACSQLSPEVTMCYMNCAILAAMTFCKPV
jgi:hypothetical protein